MINLEILRQETLTGMIQEFKPEQLEFKASGILPVRNVIGDVASWDVETTPRTKVDFTGTHSPAKPMKLNGMKQKTAQLGNVFVSKNMQASIFDNLRQPGSEAEQVAAQQQIAREEREFAAAFDRTDEFLIASALQGKIEGVKVDDLEIDDIDYGIPAANLFVYNSGTPELNCGDWLDESTDVPDALRRAKKAVRRATGYKLETLWVSDLIQQALIKNERVVRVLKSTAEGVRQLEEGTIGRLMGLNIKPVDHTYVNASNMVTPYLPENIAIATPMASDDWGFMAYGTTNIINDAKNGFKRVAGRYSYASIQENPSGLTMYAGYKPLPIIRKPGVLVKFTATAA